ncbi:MAG: TetR/AcrR family transcriptional regulator [Saprospiraceae bacterium]|nr:TetR/AcrR family transcriptional regulator [Saprospiraceae bacterium]
MSIFRALNLYEYFYSMKAVIKESRADHIIQHAKEVFFKKGYSMTAISDVCKSAGCSRTTLYSYFESKENLYLAVVKKTLSRFLGHFAALELEGKSGMDRVLTLAQGYLDYAQAAPQYYQVMLDFYGILRSINETAVQVEAHRKIKEGIYFEHVNELAQLPFKLLTEEIQTGQMDGTINSSTSPVEHMMNIWAYLKGISDVSPIVTKLDINKEKNQDLQAVALGIIRRMLEV